jgi:hypothetical protein
MPALINCSNTAQIFSLNESNFGTSFSIGSTATSAGVFYSPNGTTVGPSAFRIAGYVEYGGGLPTAGSYSSAPTALKVYSMGMKRPGDVVQTINQLGAVATVSFTTVLATTNVSASIAPTSSVNLVQYSMGVSSGNNSPASLFMTSGQIYRAGNGISVLLKNPAWATAAGMLNVLAMDAPGTTSSVAYVLKASTNGSTGTIPAATGDNAAFVLNELMG